MKGPTCKKRKKLELAQLLRLHSTLHKLPLLYLRTLKLSDSGNPPFEK